MNVKDACADTLLDSFDEDENKHGMNQVCHAMFKTS